MSYQPPHVAQPVQSNIPSTRPLQTRTTFHSHPEIQPPVQNCAEIIIHPSDPTDENPISLTLEDIELELQFAENNMLDDFGVFQDSNRAHQSIRERKLLKLLHDAKGIITRLTTKDDIQVRKITGLVRQNAICLKNISAIFQTAKNEIERKNALIAALQQQLEGFKGSNRTNIPPNVRPKRDDGVDHGNVGKDCIPHPYKLSPITSSSSSQIITSSNTKTLINAQDIHLPDPPNTSLFPNDQSTFNRPIPQHSQPPPHNINQSKPPPNTNSRPQKTNHNYTNPNQKSAHQHNDQPHVIYQNSYHSHNRDRDRNY